MNLKIRAERWLALVMLLSLLLSLFVACDYTASVPDHVDANDDGVCDECQSRVTVTLKLYAINDMHGMLMDSESQPGVDELTTWMKQQYADTAAYELLLSSGDMWQGSAESGIYNGALITEWMNELDVVSMTLGNHEFDWGVDAIYQNLALAEFPFLAINVRDGSGNTVDYCQPSVIVERGGVRIGIIGAIGDCLSSISGEFTDDLQFVVGNALTKLVQDEAQRLREQGCDLVIYSLHDSYEECYDTVLSNRNSGKGYVDIVFEGHTHRTYIVEDDYGVFHVQSGGNNAAIGCVCVEYNTVNDTYDIERQDVSHIRSSVYGASTISDDAIVQQLMDRYFPDDEDESTPENPYTEALGYNSTQRNGSVILKKVSELYLQKGEERWGQQYEIAVGGGYMTVRSPKKLTVGEVTYADLYTLLPFDNRIVLGRIRGAKLKSAFVYTKNS